MTLLINLAVSFLMLWALLAAASKLARFFAGRRDNVDDLIAQRGLHWCYDKKEERLMDTVDWDKVEASVERRRAAVAAVHARNANARRSKMRRVG